MALGLSQNTREIVSMRQRLFASQEADARAASRNASLLRDLEASLGTLKRQSHVRLADEARVAHAQAGSKQHRLREAQARAGVESEASARGVASIIAMSRASVRASKVD